MDIQISQIKAENKCDSAKRILTRSADDKSYGARVDAILQVPTETPEQVQTRINASRARDGCTYEYIQSKPAYRFGPGGVAGDRENGEDDERNCVETERNCVEDG